MRIRYQADADLNAFIVRATWRKEPSIDFQTATAAKLEGLPDYDVLAHAAHSHRILVTHDFRTMPRHFADFIQSEKSAGVLIVSQELPIASVVEDLVLIWTATVAAEWTNRIMILPL